MRKPSWNWLSPSFLSLALSLTLGLGLNPAPVAAAETRVNSEIAWPSAAPVSSSDMLAKTYDENAVHRIELPAPSAQQLERLQKANAASGRKALQVGVNQRPEAEVQDLTASLRWQAVPGGGWVSRFSVRSPGAAALRLQLASSTLPASAVFRLIGSMPDGVRAPATDGQQFRQLAKQDGAVWLPVSEGERQTVELFLADQRDIEWLDLRLAQVAYLQVSPLRAFDRNQLLPKSFGDSDSCEVDAKCFANADQAFINAKNAVAHMQYQNSQGAFVCTGTLLNDTDATTQIPHFYSAAHCFTDQATANSLSTFWFYEAASCGASSVASTVVQTSGGAQIEYADAASDVLLLKLNSAPPAGVTYSGWDAAQLTTGTAVTVIHHPKGDAKKYSLASVTSLGASNLASGSFIKVRYTLGTTEGGSSGGGVLTRGSSEYFLRGGLLGGGASCANTGTTSSGNSDDFSRFDLAFTNLRSFLAPTSNGPPAGTDFTGAWFNSNQNGWGLVILRGGSGAYAVYIYHYGSDSKPDWYLGAAALSGNRFQGTMNAFSGPWFGIVPYNPANVSSRNAGSLTIDFTTATTADVSFTIDGSTVTTSLNKLTF